VIATLAVLVPAVVPAVLPIVKVAVSVPSTIVSSTTLKLTEPLVCPFAIVIVEGIDTKSAAVAVPLNRLKLKT
jgi:hypothetical protein